MVETFKNEEDLAQSLSQEEIDKRKARISASLERLRVLGPEWTSGNGLTRDQAIAKLEDSLTELDNVRPMIVEQEENNDSRDEPVVKSHRRESQVEEEVVREARQVREGEYYSVGGINIPVCQLPENDAQWEAVPGKVFVSDGKKFSEVKFVKDVAGLTYTATPGELLDFSEKHRGKRLESVDTTLEGRGELKAFKELLAQFGELTRQYEELNPDDPDYKKNEKEIAEKIASFTDPDKLAEVFDLGQNKLDDVDGFAGRATDIIKTREFLRSLDDGVGEFVPPQDPCFKLTPYFEGKLAWFATLINRQLGLGNNAYLEGLVKRGESPNWEDLTAKGMSVIVGPRGTGKNKLADFYCSKSNRPLFRYACSPDKEERDLTYDVELSNTGTIKIPTRILTAITTPNAVLELDEVNLLRPNVAKFFNSLLDGDRALFLDNQVIKVAPGVIIVGLMNPADYNGVQDLPETIDDRSNIMTMGYPPLREIDPDSGDERFTYDEALILKEYIQPIKGISDKDLAAAWDYIINNKPADILLDAEQINIIKDLKNIIVIANRARETVESYKTRSSDERMEREISLRGSIDAARFYSENHLWENDLKTMKGWEAGWDAAQYAVAMTYLPHGDTYKRGRPDRDQMKVILAEGV